MSGSPRKTMGRPRKAADEKMGETLNMRLDAATAEQLDVLAKQVAATGMGRSTVARLCMLLGLAIAERDVRALLGPETNKPKTMKKGKP